jgi:hypothetical protein
VNDPRVIKPESDEIVDNIKKRNGVVEYVVFDNEGHGFTKKANEIRAYKAILDFLDRYLKGTATAGNTAASNTQFTEPGAVATADNYEDDYDTNPN